MRVELVLNLKDVPGTLLEAIKPISINGGNIVSVVHMREHEEHEAVPTVIYFEVSDLDQLTKIKSALEKDHIRIKEIKTDGRKLTKRKRLRVVLIGHVMATDAKNTIDQIVQVGAFVSTFEVKIVAPELHSSAMLNIEIEESLYPNLLQKLEEVAKKKNLLVIREIS
ncbi:hypothetical protein HY570_01905 [Candidatus Micrarchaeota archaeon]|nr:hypothetical protein [Candidatus Micrarchaeota archaeon]